MAKKLAMIAVAVLALSLLGCGGGNPVRVYKGTATTNITQPGGTNTVTENNKVFWVMGGDMPNEFLFVDTNTSYAATASGENITFLGNQGYSSNETLDNYMSTVTVSSGTGMLTTTRLTLNVTGTISRSSTSQGSGTASYNLMFTGERE